MRSRPIRSEASRRLAVEASAAGLAYGAGLCWASAGLVASFRPDDLSAPYWRGVPGLRTDTSGIVSFFVVAAGFAASEYLRLLRRRDAAVKPGSGPAAGATELLALAISETVALLATALVVYLSVNAITHPATLMIHATHLAAWPTEGTLRVAALLLCTCSAAALRYLVAVPTTRRAAGEPSTALTCSRADASCATSRRMVDWRTE